VSPSLFLCPRFVSDLARGCLGNLRGFRIDGFRLMFAYNEVMLSPLSCSQLRRDLSQRNMERALKRKHESTYGSIPSVIYEEDERLHGNFLDASYRAICGEPNWRRRLQKSYTGARWIPRQWDRTGRR